MQHPQFRRLVIALCAAVPALAPAPAAAQDASVVVARGITSYDLSGTGTEELWSARGRLALGLPRVELAVAAFDYGEQFGSEDLLVMPEAQLQLAPTFRRLTPYLGAGVGFAHVSRDGSDATATELTLSGALGVDAAVAGGFGVNVDGRIRSIDPWTGTSAELTVGLTYAF